MRMVIACALSTQGSVRLVQRRHCLYRVCQKTDRAAVWCRPISPEALAWMQGRGMDAERVVCDRAAVDMLIDSREGAIEETETRYAGNILPLPPRRPPHD